MGRIVIENVSKRFGEVLAVDDVGLEIDAADLFTFVGPSGCGKTTLLRMIAGLERPDSGKIWIGERLVFSSDPPVHVPAQRRDLGMVFQSYALWPHMSVSANIEFGLRARKHPRTEITRMTRAILETMQIGALGDRFPSELSGGQQQRVALAREFVTGTTTLLMDEPLSNLDARLRMDMRSELKRLHQDTGVTMVYVTHDQLEALTLSSRIAVMRGGVVEQIGTPDEVYFEPATLFVSEFIGLNPINVIRLSLASVEPDPADRAFHALALRLLREVPQAGEVVFGLRPEFLTCTDEGGDWSIGGVVETVLSAGPSDFIRVNVPRGGADGPLSLLVQQFTKARYAPGQRVHVAVDPERALVFDATTLGALA